MSNLPTLAELHFDVEEAFKNDQLNYLLNQNPHEKFLKKYTPEMGIKGGGEYMPIDKVEFLLTRIFQQWRVEIKQVGQMFNSCFAIIRLHVRNPLTGDWMYHDGAGAKSVQTDKGASAADLGSIKDAAVMMALPTAISYAVKDAAERFGKIFGRDLNRKDTIPFYGAYDQVIPPQGDTGGAVENTENVVDLGDVSHTYENVQQPVTVQQPAPQQQQQPASNADDDVFNNL